jgi:hypothetical protein
MSKLLLVAGACLVLSGCITGYQLVEARPVKVSSGALTVRPGVPWNRAPKGPYAVPEEESWTQNGPMLDSITFIAGLKEGAVITKQKAKDDRKVPTFRADMTPQDLVAMVESYYRIRLSAQVFETSSIKPASFVGVTGVQFDYNYVGPDQIKRRGRAVLGVRGGKLYLMLLDGTALHYFEAAVPEFESIVASAAAS